MNNHSIFICLIITFLATFQANAQFRLGGKVGLSNNTISTSDDFFETSLKGYYYGGLQMGYHWNDYWGIAVDFNFTQKGAEIEDNFGNISNFEVDYIDLIPTLVFSPVEFLELKGGVYAGALIQETFDEEVFLNREIAESVDVGAYLGAKAIFMNVFIELGYQFGLTKINSNELSVFSTQGEAPAIVDPEFQNRTILVGIGYQLVFE